MAFKLPPVGRFQTKSQRLNRLDVLIAAERQRLQSQFKKEANLAAQGMGRAQGLADSFAPHGRSRYAPPVTTRRTQPVGGQAVAPPRQFEPTAPADAERFRTSFQPGRAGPEGADLFTPVLSSLRAKAQSGAPLSEPERQAALRVGYSIAPTPSGQAIISGIQETPAQAAGVPGAQPDIGAPHGEPPFPGIAGKVPGFRTPAELAATIATLGVGGPVRGVGATILGSAGAYGGGRAAPEVGLPAWAGELGGGLAGGFIGAAVAPSVARRTGALVGEAAERARLQPELGGGLKKELPSEGGAVPPGREPPPESPLSKLTQAIKGAKKATPEQWAMFAQQRAQRTGAAASVLERGIAKGKGAKAFGQAKGQLAGEFERPEFAVPEFTQTDMHQLVQDIGTSEIPFYKKLNAQSALEDLARGRIPQPAQLKALKMAFPQGSDELVKALLSKRSLGEKAVAELVSFLGLPQKLKASYDMGTRFRQSLVLGWSHPRQWLSNWKPTKDALFSEKAAQETMANIESNPWFSVKSGEQAGLGFDDLGGHIYDWESFTAGPERVEGFQGMNESWINSATDRIPGLKGSQRSFAVDLNKAGVEVYAQEAQAMWSAGVRDPEMYKAVLKVINHARGYGAFNPGQIGKGVSAFFSGRNLVARFQVALDPLVQPGSLFKPSARQLAAKTLVGLIAGDMAVLGLIGTAGAATGLASVEFNPLKPGADWLKVRIGDTRLDPWGGFIPMARLIARMGAAAATETGLADTQYDMASVKRELLTFFSNKEAPLVRKFTDAVGMSEAYDPSKLLSVKTLVDIYSPFVSQDIWDAVKQQGWGIGAIAGVVSPVGIGVQTYTNPTEQLKRLFEEKYGRPFNPETDYRVAEQDKDFDFLLDRIRRQGMERGQEGAKRIEQAEQTRAQTEQELGLPELARQFQAGAENGPALISRWEDLNSQMAGAYGAIYIGSDPKKKETPDGQTLQRLSEMNPNLAPWTDFETGEVDWDGFYTERERLESSLSPDVKKAYRAFTAKSIDSDLRAVEPEIARAKELRRGFYDLPRWLSIVKNQDRIEEIQKLAADKNLELARQGIPDADSRMVYELVGLEVGDVQTALAAWQLRSGSRTGTELRSPERDRFLVENAKGLERFFPDLYRRELLQVQLGMR